MDINDIGQDVTKLINFIDRDIRHAFLYTRGALRAIAASIERREILHLKRTDQESRDRITQLITMLQQIPRFRGRQENDPPVSQPLVQMSSKRSHPYSPSISQVVLLGDSEPESDAPRAEILATRPSWAIGLRNRAPRTLFIPKKAIPTFIGPKITNFMRAVRRQKELQEEAKQKRKKPMTSPMPMLIDLGNTLTDLIYLQMQLKTLNEGTPEYTSKSAEILAKDEEIVGSECVCGRVITLEQMLGEDNEGITFCSQCGNTLHLPCALAWFKTRKDNGQSPMCPFCKLTVQSTVYDPFVIYTPGRASEDFFEIYSNSIIRANERSNMALGPGRARAPLAIALIDLASDDAPPVASDVDLAVALTTGDDEAKRDELIRISQSVLPDIQDVLSTTTTSQEEAQAAVVQNIGEARRKLQETREAEVQRKANIDAIMRMKEFKSLTDEERHELYMKTTGDNIDLGKFKTILYKSLGFQHGGKIIHKKRGISKSNKRSKSMKRSKSNKRSKFNKRSKSMKIK